MIQSVPQSWQSALKAVFDAPEALRLAEFLQAEEDSGKSIYPPRDQRLRALEITPLESVKIVILGQDPYHGAGQAHGLSFSVPDGVKIPPSLVNIYKELQSDLGIEPPMRENTEGGSLFPGETPSGNLEHWAKQGVLLLNHSLSVEAGKAGSHSRHGWAAITDRIVRAVAERDQPSVFILWGGHAQGKAARIDALQSGNRHLLIKTPHPSPLSSYRGFFGSKPFSQANDFLEKHGRGSVGWGADNGSAL